MFTTALQQATSKFEALMVDLESVENSLQETREQTHHWQTQANEEFALVASDYDQLTETLHTFQGEIHTTASAAEAILGQGTRQIEAARTNLTQEADTLRASFASLRGQYQEMDAELTSLLDEFESSFAQTQEQLVSDQTALADAVTAAEDFLRNDFIQAREQASAIVAERNASLRTGIIQSFVPQIKNQITQLANHLQDVTRKLEQGFLEKHEQVPRQAEQAMLNYENQQGQELSVLANVADNLSRQSSGWSEALSRTNTEVVQGLDNLKNASQNLQDAIGEATASLERAIARLQV